MTAKEVVQRPAIRYTLVAAASASLTLTLAMVHDRITIETRMATNVEHLAEIDRRLTQHDEQIKMLIDHAAAQLDRADQANTKELLALQEIKIRLRAIERRLRIVDEFQH